MKHRGHFSSQRRSVGGVARPELRRVLALVLSVMIALLMLTLGHSAGAGA